MSKLFSDLIFLAELLVKFVRLGVVCHVASDIYDQSIASAREVSLQQRTSWGSQNKDEKFPFDILNIVNMSGTVIQGTTGAAE